ncbi:hypothetical protein HS088_TW07G01060 [Tripterygium wilfordii]|uniref:Uncharacterized protein n=1 Tax=Tripterygium wilfordii TaxID=458696 RepID=A0A7J7DHE2_TRIWF|nr:hypothetical protein HS088_TW07G01060 [Tripterygium wilfordii]
METPVSILEANLENRMCILEAKIEKMSNEIDKFQTFLHGKFANLSTTINLLIDSKLTTAFERLRSDLIRQESGSMEADKQSDSGFTHAHKVFDVLHQPEVVNSHMMLHTTSNKNLERNSTSPPSVVLFSVLGSEVAISPNSSSSFTYEVKKDLCLPIHSDNMKVVKRKEVGKRGQKQLFVKNIERAKWRTNKGRKFNNPRVLLVGALFDSKEGRRKLQEYKMWDPGINPRIYSSLVTVNLGLLCTQFRISYHTHHLFDKLPQSRSPPIGDSCIVAIRNHLCVPNTLFSLKEFVDIFSLGCGVMCQNSLVHYGNSYLKGSPFKGESDSPDQYQQLDGTNSLNLVLESMMASQLDPAAAMAVPRME